jgi:hypothetical protein
MDKMEKVITSCAIGAVAGVGGCIVGNICPPVGIFMIITGLVLIIFNCIKI